CVAHAKLTRFVIDATRSQSPTFGGHVFADIGTTYDKIVGTGSGELDPNDSKNSVMVDLQLAPRTVTATCPTGCVQYSFEFYILKPHDLTNGAHKVMYEPPNRGRKTWEALGRSAAGNDPGSAAGAAPRDDACFLPRRYTVVLIGWA